MWKLQRWTALAVIGVMSVSVIGCQTMDEHRTATGAIGGALIGAAAGALIDNNNRGRGALIGAAAGGVIGGGVGYYLQRQKDKFEAIEGARVTQGPVGVPPAGGPTAQPDSAAPVQTREGLTITMQNEILFARASSTLTGGGVQKIAEIAAVLREYPDSDVIIKGHSSSEGEDSYNMDLSERRARMVLNQLIANRTAPARLIAIGMGESNPIATNDTETGRIQNRRVEIDIVPREEIR